MIDEKQVCCLINAAITGKGASIPPNIEMDEYLSFSRRQQIGTLLISGAVKSGWKMTMDVRKVYYSCVMASEQQLHLMHKIYVAFEQQQVDYLPLKGAVMKLLYPSPEMRPMADIDILIRQEQYSAIKSIMTSLGLREQQESDHELIWTNGHFTIELHKRLIPSYNKDYYAYYGDGWRLAKPTEETYRYTMSPEDTYIYLFTHYAKHYRDAGAGIRQVLDLHVFRMAHTDMNEHYIQQQLELLQLERFYRNTKQVLDVWFADAEHTEASKLISERLFLDGVFGDTQSGHISDMLKRSNSEGSVGQARIKRWRGILFPNLKDMCLMYPLLKRKPWLLPVMWCVRGVRTLLYKKERLKQITEQMNHTTEDEVVQYHEMLKKSGLDFNFK